MARDTAASGAATMDEARLNFLSGGGEVGALIRGRDWAATPLGPPERWPAALRIVVGTMLGSRQPMAMNWGPDLTFLYNDAFALLLGGKHPSALGRPNAEVWPEFWDRLSPLMERVLDGGEPAWAEDQLFVTRRHGHAEKVHITYSFGPIRDEEGAVRGVFCTCVETTAKVQHERRLTFQLRLSDRLRDLAAAQDIMAAASEEVGRALQAARVGYGEIDAAGQTVSVDRDWTDGTVVSLAGETRPLLGFGRGVIAELLAGRTLRLDDVATDPRTNDPVLLAAFDGIGARSMLVVPLLKDGRLAAIFYLHEPGRRRWTDAEVMMAEDAAERTWAAVARARAEAALRAGEERLDTLVRNLPVAVVFHDAKGEVLLSNPAARRHPPDAEERRVGRRALRGEAVPGQEFLHRSPDGEGSWTRVSGVPLRDSLGRITGAITVAVDIDAQKRTEAALRESEARLKAIFETVPFGIVIVEAPSGRVVMGNPQTERIFRHPIHPTPGLEGYPEWRVFHPDGRRVEPRDYPVMRTITLGEPTPEEEYLYQRGDGSMAWMRFAAAPIRDASGSVVAGVVAIMDIDREKRTEEALRRLNETLEQRVADQARERDRIWRISQALMLVAGADGTLIAVNPAWTAILGWAEEELIGRCIFDFVHPEDVGRTLEENAGLALGLTTSRFENRFRGKDGDYRWISWTAAPDGELVHSVGRDITAEKAAEAALRRAEEQLRQSQKMEAVGQLTGGIAHDFNNLLQAMGSSIEVVGRRLADGRGEVEPFLRTARLSIERAASLTQRLLAFSRRQPLQPEPVDLNALVVGMEDLIRRTVGVAVRVDTVAAEGLWPSWADANQVESALLNLIINARDAMPDGGRVTIETANVELDAVYASAEPGLEPGPYVMLCVTDTGAGMTPDVLERAFEPFFTTKPLGQGTGLGLSQLYGFVRQSGGHVRIDSVPGQGTSVALYLPRHHGPAATVAEPPAVSVPAARGGRILLVEDEALIRAMLLEALCEEGHEIAEAEDGPSALDVLEGPLPLDLLVTDVGLPGLNGRQVAEMARRLRPGLKVLFLTGYAHGTGLGEEAFGPGTQLLTKPVALGTLLAKVAAMLAEDPGA
ncbi:PAS domain S-box protein [Azospirillum sp. SYSU D00513]|uniref:PAS domain S-box protein n=1 Tax=Azospirillum sp. SYSU D00513 TaxID=2812561 RepID=UPI001A961E85|nr:PAS domain S-box protein [Azospirillum sp. SYSU D00513]